MRILYGQIARGDLDRRVARGAGIARDVDRDLVERHGDWRPRAAPSRPGYQAAGTRGRALKDGARFTRIHGQEIPVAAKIVAVDSMSAHADANEILRWLGGFTRPPALTCLVHGEPGPMDVLKARIERELGWTVKAPLPQEKMDI